MWRYHTTNPHLSPEAFMDPARRCDVAVGVVETTIRALAGHFRKGGGLKAFYRAIRNGQPRAFVVLRSDPDDFVGVLMGVHGTTVQFELWVDMGHRDDGPTWCDAAQKRFDQRPNIHFQFRSPEHPIALARSMGFVVPKDRDEDPPT
jgi:hypothetical protein